MGCILVGSQSVLDLLIDSTAGALVPMVSIVLLGDGVAVSDLLGGVAALTLSPVMGCILVGSQSVLDLLVACTAGALVPMVSIVLVSDGVVVFMANIYRMGSATGVVNALLSFCSRVVAQPVVEVVRAILYCC